MLAYVLLLTVHCISGAGLALDMGLAKCRYPVVTWRGALELEQGLL